MEEEADDPGARVGPARERRPLRGSPAGGEMVPPRTKSQAGRRCDRRTTPRDQRFHWSHQTPTDDPDLVNLSFAPL